ncbi:MAG: GntR family transcriptional regulator [Mogibacterium sp.]|nr:GntR family transcriptional regulator [Mogibacterium sp.]
MGTDPTLSERIYDELYRDITRRRLKCGQNLTLNMLKEHFNVSHTPIREALTRLAADGLVSYSTNKGMKVIEFSEVEIREIFQFTAELETVAIKLCSNSFTLAPLTSELEHIIQEESEALKTGDIKRWESVAGKFHELFFTYSGNRYLVEASHRMGARMELMSNIYSKEERFTTIHQRHSEIYNAIKDRDFDKACDLVHAHLQFSMVDALQGYKEEC